jgi:hypothetical protein
MSRACAKSCPTGSIQFGPIEELRERAHSRLNELKQRGVQDALLYGDGATDRYSVLRAFFLLVDRPSHYGLPEDPKLPQRNLAGDYLRSAAGTILWIAAALAAFVPPWLLKHESIFVDGERIVTKAPPWHLAVTLDLFLSSIASGTFIVSGLSTPVEC